MDDKLKKIEAVLDEKVRPLLGAHGGKNDKGDARKEQKPYILRKRG